MKLTAYFVTIVMVFVVSGNSTPDIGHNIYQSSCSPITSMSVISESDEAEQVLKAFQLYSIVPQLIENAPASKVHLRYYENAIVDLGNYIFPFKIGYKPFIYWNYNEDSLYTLVYINPDLGPDVVGVHGDPRRAFLSGLEVNIPGDDYLSGQLLAAYVPYLPPPCAKPNRNIVLVYEQNHVINVTVEMQINVLRNVSSFDINAFVDEHDLGDPVAGNFFTTYLFFCNEQ